MIRVLYSVLVDLWHFAWGRETEAVSLGVTPKTASPAEPPRQVTKPLLIGDEVTARTAYVQSYRTDCYVREQPAFDELRTVLHFGTTVLVRRINDHMAEVDTPDGRGWVSAAALTDDPRDVQPTLEAGVAYHHTDPETRKLRQHLRDEALGDFLALPLQPLEYVLYQLQLRRRRIAWPETRPRRVGTVHQLLRGQPGVTIGVEPKTSSLIEGMETETHKAFLGVVVAVQPDGTITVQSVGRVNAGEFRVEHFTRTAWREFRPVFISFS